MLSWCGRVAVRVAIAGFAVEDRGCWVGVMRNAEQREKFRKAEERRRQRALEKAVPRARVVRGVIVRDNGKS